MHQEIEANKEMNVQIDYFLVLFFYKFSAKKLNNFWLNRDVEKNWIVGLQSWANRNLF